MPVQAENNVHFPLLGVDKRLAYRQQPPYSTPDALNVRPVGPFERRARGGRRPGLGYSHYTQMGGVGGDPIRLLDTCRVVKSDGADFWADSFRGTTLGDAWTQATWLSAAPAIWPKAESDIAYTESEVGVVADALDDFDTSQAYQIDLFVVPWLGQHHGTYKIFARMDDSAPDGSDEGIQVELTMTGENGDYDGKIVEYNAGVPTEYAFTAGSSGQPEAGWFSVYVSTNTVTVRWLGTQVVSQAVTAHTGKRFGFGMHCTVDGGVTLVDTFRISYYHATAVETVRNILVASAGGNLYYEHPITKIMTLVSTNLSLASDHAVQSTDYGQKLYIADYGDLEVSGTDGVITSGKLDATSVADWTALGLNIYDYKAVITSITGGSGDLDGVTAITVPFSVIHATDGLALTGYTGSCTTCSYRVERAPKIYDPAANTLTLWGQDNGGRIPLGCRATCLFNDRVMLAGQMDAPHAWYAPRAGDPLDWDYSPADTDAERPIYGDLADAGAIGEPIRALMPHSDIYLHFGCQTSIWAMVGDPADEGMIYNISRVTGVLDVASWCRGPSGELLFWGRDGLYMLPPGPGGTVQSISRERLPDELLDIDPNQYECLLAYDVRDRGVHLYGTPKQARNRIHWWYDWGTKGFWPVSLQDDHEPFAILQYVADFAEDSAVLLGGRDGYLRRYRDVYDHDCGSGVAAHVMFGPMPLSKDFFNGLLREMRCVLGEGSGDVAWQVRAAETPEAAVTAAVSASGTWSVGAASGLDFAEYPRARGGWATIRLSSSDTLRRWTFEMMAVVIRAAGRQRKI